MEHNGNPAVNNKKTLFMKRQGSDFIFHCLLVDDMMHVSTSDVLSIEFMGGTLLISISPVEASWRLLSVWRCNRPSQA
jgi:hypothetical protein